MDFLSGCAYALDGKIKKVAISTYIITPYNVDIVGDLIDELENNRRNLYTGSIGYLTLDGDCDFNIVIRTALHKDGMYYLGVGGGITAESDLEFEYEETLQKAKAVLEAMK